MTEPEKCVLCDKFFDEWGNNPWPLAEEGRCCDDCNLNVIAARLLDMARRTRGGKNNA
jgi:hypothetical protein